ncbi:MAG: hypothetical protein H7Y32_20525 [Chloroflexales bacterium]|nr:hypothetical protein [Chloroflexales bacterium]
MVAPVAPARLMAIICFVSALVLFFSWRQSQPQTFASPWSSNSLPVLAGDAGGLNLGGGLMEGGGGLVFNARPAGQSVPLTTQGDVGFNVLAALNASGGALRDVTIAPGATWSFNATVGNPGGIEILTVGGIAGGGWCDLAARYVQAVRPLLPGEAIRFPHHGIALADVAWEDAVSIWNIGGQAGTQGGAQDLEITNTLPHPLRLQALPTPDGSAVMVLATILDS